MTTLRPSGLRYNQEDWSCQLITTTTSRHMIQDGGDDVQDDEPARLGPLPAIHGGEGELHESGGEAAAGEGEEGGDGQG